MADDLAYLRNPGFSKVCNFGLEVDSIVVVDYLASLTGSGYGLEADSIVVVVADKLAYLDMV